MSGNCFAGNMEFCGSYTLTDTSIGNDHVYTWEVERFAVRPAGGNTSPDLESDEYFFHGYVNWSYPFDSVLGTFGAGLGSMSAMDPISGTTGFEAHNAGTAPGPPSWSHVYVKGTSEAALNGQKQVEYSHDLYVTSDGFWTFTSFGVDLISDSNVCSTEPLSGGIGITGIPMSILFAPDGQSSCDGEVPIYGGAYQLGYYSDPIW